MSFKQSRTRWLMSPACLPAKNAIQNPGFPGGFPGVSGTVTTIHEMLGTSWFLARKLALRASGVRVSDELPQLPALLFGEFPGVSGEFPGQSPQYTKCMALSASSLENWLCDRLGLEYPTSTAITPLLFGVFQKTQLPQRLNWFNALSRAGRGT